MRVIQRDREAETKSETEPGRPKEKFLNASLPTAAPSAHCPLLLSISATQGGPSEIYLLRFAKSPSNSRFSPFLAPLHRPLTSPIASPLHPTHSPPLSLALLLLTSQLGRALTIWPLVVSFPSRPSVLLLIPVLILAELRAKSQN